MHFLAQNGLRVVAQDRRGHGRSTQVDSGNDMGGYADDLALVINTLDLKAVTVVGHSTGGGEVPVKDSAKKSARLIKGAKEIYYPGAPHGLTATHQDQVNADLLAFLQSDGAMPVGNNLDLSGFTCTANTAQNTPHIR